METYPGVKTMDIENVSSFQEYRQYINELCDIIENEYNIENSNDPYNIIHENIDSAKAIMYYSYNMTILNYSDSEPHEWQIYVENNEKDYKKVLQGMAYATLQYDITIELSERGLLD